jgi:uncharacterized coiled-coil protein SlyX
VKRPAKCAEPAPVVRSGNDWASWRDRLTLGACAAVVALGSILYVDIKSGASDREARIRAVETRQAVVEATRVDVERRLQTMEAELKKVNDKLDQLLRRGVDK